MYPKKNMTDEELMAYAESDEFLNGEPPTVSYYRTPMEILRNAFEMRNNAIPKKRGFEERNLTLVVVQSKVIHDCTWAEIADVLKISEKDAIRRYGKLAQQLRERLASTTDA